MSDIPEVGRLYPLIEPDDPMEIPQAIVLDYWEETLAHGRSHWLISLQEQFRPDGAGCYDAATLERLPGDYSPEEAQDEAELIARERGLPCYWFDPAKDNPPEVLYDPV
jgi:hypothetical protein